MVTSTRNFYISRVNDAADVMTWVRWGVVGDGFYKGGWGHDPTIAGTVEIWTYCETKIYRGIIKIINHDE